MPNLPTIVIRMINASNRSLVHWAPSGRYTFTAKFGADVTATITSRDGDGVAPYDLHITGLGEPTIVSGDTDDAQYNGALRELYAAAQASAVDTSPAVQEILKELDRFDEPPF